MSKSGWRFWWKFRPWFNTCVSYCSTGILDRYTLSALQILSICNKLDLIDQDRVATFIKGLYQPDGSFFSDKYGELDLRFNYCAVQSMALLHRLNELNIDQIANYICSCQNIDGGCHLVSFVYIGFGSIPGSESHSGMVFCAVGALSILQRLLDCNVQRLCYFLDSFLSCRSLAGPPPSR